MDTSNIKALGNKVTKFEGFDTFPRPEGVQHVTMVSDEVTALCPITGQPDFYQVTVEYFPGEKCLESKCLKLYFQSFREHGEFCEALGARIAKDISAALGCEVHTVIEQKPRGGVGIVSEAWFNSGEPDDLC